MGIPVQAPAVGSDASPLLAELGVVPVDSATSQAGRVGCLARVGLAVFFFFLRVFRESCG